MILKRPADAGLFLYIEKSHMNKFKIVVTSFLLVFLCSAVSAGMLSGISVFPTRIIMNEGRKDAAITLNNTSGSEVNYRMGIVEMGFDEESKFIEVAEEKQPPGFKSLASLIRFSPRQVRLKPGESQVIRILLSNNRNTEKGEYRSHFEIVALPDISAFDINNIAKSGRRFVSKSTVITKLGVTLPVVWRNGELDAAVDIQYAKFGVTADGRISRLSMKINRTGDRSVFGDFVVKIKMRDGAEKNVSVLNDYGLYFPYLSETVVFSVSGLKIDELNSSRAVMVEFINDEEKIGEEIIFSGELEWSLETDN